MRKIVISYTGCLIVPDKINKLYLLNKLYAELITTPEIASQFGLTLPGWIHIISSTNKEFQNNLEQKIDLGEASAIALGIELKECSIILDDLKARKIACDLKLDYTGTVGIIVKAKMQGFIPVVKSIIIELKKQDYAFLAKWKKISSIKQKNYD